MIASRFNRDPAARAVLVAQVALVLVVAVTPELAFAQSTMPGQQLLTFAKNFIIAPIALFAIVISGVAAFIRPDLIKTTGYIAIIAVILYFLLANADRLMQAIRAG
jgi:predicted neutral ceramidase superfamily lipid hydrolase